jgi:hypothetical protein
MAWCCLRPLEPPPSSLVSIFLILLSWPGLKSIEKSSYIRRNCRKPSGTFSVCGILPCSNTFAWGTLGSGSLYRKIISLKIFDRKAIWPIHDLTEHRLTESSLHRKVIWPIFFQKMVIWPNLLSTKNVIWRKKIAHKVVWPFLGKKHSIKWTFGQMTFRSDDHFLEKAFGQMKFRSNYLSVKWPFFEKRFRSNELSVICHFGHLTSFSS